MSNHPMSSWSLSGVGLVAVLAAACTEIQPAPRNGLLLTEVAADGRPYDWIEVVNVSGQWLELVDYVYVDVRGDLDRARPFPDVTLGPGERYLLPISYAHSGFGLADHEEVWIHRASDGALVDGVDWGQGDLPAGGSLGRLGDTGDFVAWMVPSPRAPNPGRRGATPPQEKPYDGRASARKP